MAKIAVISGSPTETSRLNGLLQAVRARIEGEGWDYKEIQVRLLPPEDLIYTRFDSPSIVEANRIVAEADAVIVATPIYKASYTGVLKTFLDLIPQKGLAGKIVLPLALGGTIAHLLAIDYALRPVLSALGSQHIRGGVYALDAQVSRLEGGGFVLEEELLDRLELAAADLVREIRKSANEQQSLVAN
ncbi:NADPH-dependent FMN reductase [Paenibacillus puerhi]|uniref:NADPH-dependent FMN reductase n=1 Tax=Paenibacillus puerhi TaxID=2692622 RepID=UPI00135CE9F9|nr:NADPH-dependent FMN reductase [Paenibacillus puerhi]